MSLAAPRVPVRVALSSRDSDDISEKDLYLNSGESVLLSRHLQALGVFVALNCRPLCRITAASNIKTTKIFFFVTSSLLYSHVFLCMLDLITITILYLSETDVGVFWTTSRVSLMLVIPGNIHAANCTGGPLAHDPALGL